jgi:hypothetical protein
MDAKRRVRLSITNPVIFPGTGERQDVLRRLHYSDGLIRKKPGGVMTWNRAPSVMLTRRTAQPEKRVHSGGGGWPGTVVL